MCDISLVSTTCCATFQMLSTSLEPPDPFVCLIQVDKWMSPPLQKKWKSSGGECLVLRYLSTSTTFVLILFPYFLKVCSLSLFCISSFLTFPETLHCFIYYVHRFFSSVSHAHFLNICKSRLLKVTSAHPG